MDKLRLVTRADLPAGARASQLVHATAEFFYHHNEEARGWYEQSNTVVLLEALTERDLHDLAARVRAARVHEPDLNNALTALAILHATEGRKATQKLPLAFRSAVAR